MAILKIRDADGKVHEIPSIVGRGLKLTYLGNLCKDPNTGEVETEYIYVANGKKLFYELSYGSNYGDMLNTVQCGILSISDTGEYRKMLYTNLTYDILYYLGIVDSSGSEPLGLDFSLDFDTGDYVLDVTDGVCNPFLYLQKDEYGYLYPVFFKLYLME